MIVLQLRVFVCSVMFDWLLLFALWFSRFVGSSLWVLGGIWVLGFGVFGLWFGLCVQVD